ncbi:MAG: biopolymer transporter ExbD [Verrucomicrobiota bacterium JB023]|nr:biopolymer transporter ExbD [Verrucomicrobiota bacterium JB023]
MASKKLRSAMSGDEGELKVDMSPMIDMVFLLLIFFVVTASFVVVEMDPTVEVPVALDASPQDEARGRIVVNVYADDDSDEGRYKMEDGTPFADDEAIKQFIQEEKDKVAATIQPKLHLRGDRNVEFKHCRRVIQVAASVGVDQVVFASYATSNKY